MSVQFDASLNTEIGDPTLATSILADQCTIVCAFRWDASQTDAAARFYAVQRDSGSFNDSHSLYVDFGDTRIRRQFRVNGSGTVVTEHTNRSVDTWYIDCFKMDSATTYSSWLDGVRRFTGQATSVDYTGRTLDTVYIGGRDGSSQDLDGYVANFAIWNTQLSDDICESLSLGLSPLAVGQAPVLWWPGLFDRYVDNMQLAELADVNASSPTLASGINPRLIFPE